MQLLRRVSFYGFEPDGPAASNLTRTAAPCQYLGRGPFPRSGGDARRPGDVPPIAGQARGSGAAGQARAERELGRILGHVLGAVSAHVLLRLGRLQPTVSVPWVTCPQRVQREDLTAH